MSVALSVNLNKIALLRNSREGEYPSIVHFAERALNLGADGITLHPRPDQRHIRTKDTYDIAQLMKAFGHKELNIEGNPFASAKASYPGLMSIIENIKPDQCTLVPDSDNQLTSDHGFDLNKDAKRLEPIVEHLKRLNIRVSLFMDPNIHQIERAKELGADRIELYTGDYAKQALLRPDDIETIAEPYFEAAEVAHSLGLGVNAGHDLNLNNLPYFVKAPNLQEVSIGHALTVDALILGYDNAVNAYKTICQNT